MRLPAPQSPPNEIAACRSRKKPVWRRVSQVENAPCLLSDLDRELKAALLDRGMSMPQFVMFDDDQAFAIVLKKALLKHGLHCDVYARVDDFLENADQNVDLFMVDLAMPDPSGVHWEFGGLLNVSKVRDARGRDTPVWVLTGYDDARIERECRRNGADKVIFKGDDIGETADDIAIHWRWRNGDDRRRFR